MMIARKAAGLLLALVGSAWGGVTLTMNGDTEKDRSILYIEGNKLRIERSSQSTVIFDGDAQKMIMIDPAKKTYWEMTREQMKEVGAQAKKQMEAAMAKVSPEQRKQMEQMMSKMDPEQRKKLEALMAGQSDGSTHKKEADELIKWEPTGGHQTIVGFPCEGFKVMHEGKEDAEGCYIPWSAGAVTKADLAPMKKMAEFFSGGTFDLKAASDQQFAKLDKLPGFPGVWEHVSDDGKHGRKEKLTAVKRGSVSADKFQAPSGYTKAEAPWKH